VDENTIFDLERHGKLHVLSAGTKIVQHTPPAKMQGGMKGIEQIFRRIVNGDCTYKRTSLQVENKENVQGSYNPFPRASGITVCVIGTNFEGTSFLAPALNEILIKALQFHFYRWCKEMFSAQAA